jgi:hypothetical protein
MDIAAIGYTNDSLELPYMSDMRIVVNCTMKRISSFSPLCWMLVLHHTNSGLKARSNLMNRKDETDNDIKSVL